MKLKENERFGLCWTGDISEAETAYPSGAPEFTLVFSAVRVTRSLVLSLPTIVHSQGTWLSLNTLPAIVHSQAFCFITE